MAVKEEMEKIVISARGNSGLKLNRCGFTLIEIIVTMVVISIAIGVVTVNLSNDPRALLQEEAERLASILESVGDQARVGGTVIGFSLKQGRYHFLESTDGQKWEELNDSWLVDGKLDYGIYEKSVKIDGKVTDTEDLLIFYPGADPVLFQITLALEKETVTLMSNPLGEVFINDAPESS